MSAFEWDETKRQSNLKKHGVDFSDAVGVFYDLTSTTVEDGAAEGEARYNTLGIDSLGRMLIVSWTERGEKIRLISARPASPGEARQY